MMVCYNWIYDWIWWDKWFVTVATISTVHFHLYTMRTLASYIEMVSQLIEIYLYMYIFMYMKYNPIFTI